MHAEQRQQTADLLGKNGLERALFASPDSVKWLTGFAPAVQLGPNFFAGGPPLVWYEDGTFTLIVVDAYQDTARAFGEQPDGQVVTYLGYTIEQPLAGAEHLAAVLRQTLSPSGKNVGQVGVEELAVTAFVARVVRDTLSDNLEWARIDGWLEPLRMIKTEEELVKLRENFGLTDLGHAVARTAVDAGEREIDVWTEVHKVIEQAAGQRVPLGNDCVVNYRQNNIGGWPLEHALKRDDTLILDLSTVLHGYWSDSCATYYVNDPTPAQVRVHETVAQALEFGISLVRPGAVAREIDQKVRGFIADRGYPVYPHHTGHGVGVSGHEAPRIVPYNDQVLQEGMVVMLEPGIYLPGEVGVRLEDALLVTADGAQVLTRHDKGLP
jgi:Xaa-Pro dipeptidase